MPIIGPTDYKATRGRLVIAGIYLLLTLGGLAMICPFLVMLTGSVSNPFDYERRSLFPRFLWSREDRLMRLLANVFPPLPRNSLQQMKSVFPDCPDDWALWIQIGDERAATDVERAHQRKGTLAARFHRGPSASRPPVAARLVGVGGPVAGQSFDLLTETVIGRTSSSQVQIAHPSLSRAHVRVLYVDDRFVLQDLGSTHGTQVNGARVNAADLHAGDVIQIGEIVLRFEMDPP